MAAPIPPQCVVLAGPNGAGKSTAAPALLPEALQIRRFLNADTIARGLSGFDPESEAFAAGRILLTQMDDYIRERLDFAVETTLSGRTLAKRVRDMKAAGYSITLFFLWVPAAEFSMERVSRRVAAGGHDIPRDTLRRRHDATIKNFFRLYRPLADAWTLYDNSGVVPLDPIATGSGDASPTLLRPDLWHELRERYDAPTLGSGERSPEAG
ncbi:zeta toxin family protein [Alienimonas chondri]|uniref:UDP-N-acetylglucosamine kinase n=1 Tax=Alienimonas chondri TaxID=2681879 RepID=A0ABX1VJC7_9PLAN|nr:zeta toxin family protein [Alienimonas chondri]NNJ27561.1 hypothetical protein [Alienimonas chondri]